MNAIDLDRCDVAWDALKAARIALIAATLKRGPESLAPQRLRALHTARDAHRRALMAYARSWRHE